MMKKRYLFYVVAILTIVLAACAPAATPAPAAEAPAAEAPAAEAPAGAPEACAADALGCAVVKPGETVKVGMGGPMTGDYSMFGIDISQGVELAFKQSGGVDGFDIQLVVEDTQGSPEAGAAVANRFVTDPTMVAIAGHIFSGETEAAMPIYEKAGFPMLSPSATNPPLTQRGSAVFNRTAFTDATQAAAAAEMMFNTLGYTKIAVMHDGSSYGQGLADTVRTRFEELGGTVVAYEAITPGEVDYIAPLSTIAGNSPEAVYFGGYAAEAIVMANEWNQAGLTGVTLFGCDGTYGVEFTDKTGPNGEGSIAVSLVPPASAEKDAFDAAYKEAYGTEAGELSAFTWSSYDVGNVLVDAIRKVAVLGDDGNLYFPRSEMVAAVRGTTDFMGLTGKISCDDTGECNASGPNFYIVENGQWVPFQK